MASVAGTFLFVWLVPASEQQVWANAPLAGLSQHLAGPAAVRNLLALALALAAGLVLLPAAHAAVSDAEQMLHRFSAEGTLPPGLTSLHSRFGTPARAIDITVIATTVAVLASGARVSWLAHAYGVAIAITLALSIAALIRLRGVRQLPMPYTAPGDVRVGRRHFAAGLVVARAVTVACVVGMIVAGNIAAIATATVMTILAAWFTVAARHRPPVETGTDETAFDLMLAAELSPTRSKRVPAACWCPFATRTCWRMSRRLCRRPAIATSSP